MMKLYYLPLRARAETIHLILEYGKIPYQSIIIPFKEWPALKYKKEINLFGQLPSLSLPDGTVISESGAIIRFVARLANVYPSNELELVKADMLLELSQDMYTINRVLCLYEKDSELWQAKRDQYFSSFPLWLSGTQELLGERTYFGGHFPHFGDFSFLHVCNCSLHVKHSCLDEYPLTRDWYNRMISLPAVASYFASRPGPTTPDWGRPKSFIMSS